MVATKDSVGFPLKVPPSHWDSSTPGFRLPMPKPARVTLQTIADMTGVSKSTVCDVLHERQGKVRVPDATKKLIYEAVKRTGYHPRASAQALATGRTNQIGFLVSSKMTLGLANSMYATMMSGAQEACKKFDYACVISAYDLSSVKRFVVPRKVRSKRVDGLVLCGYVEDEVLQKFIDVGMPFILVGMSTDYPRQNILATMFDIPEVWTRCFTALYQMGHRHVGVGGIDSKNVMDMFNQIFDRFQARHPDMRFTTYGINRDADQFDYAYKKSKDWVAESNRPTAVCGHEHWCMGFHAGICDAGLHCPQDVSILCTVESPYAAWLRPSLTSFSPTSFNAVQAATELLIQLLEKRITWIQAKQQIAGLWPRPELVFRQSTAPPGKSEHPVE